MKILVVEDESDVANATKAGLEAKGFTVDVACDGPSGLEMARQNDYAIILLDVILPGIDGYTVCSQLREENIQTPILMLTAKGDDQDLAEGLNRGADDYLAKPYSSVVLMARIQALLRRTKQSTQQVVSVAGLELNPETRRVRRGEHETTLTHREYALLETLANEPGKVLTKQELLDSVWGLDFDGGVNVVEVYMGYLRKKIQPKGEIPVLETVHGHGYRLKH